MPEDPADRRLRVLDAEAHRRRIARTAGVGITDSQAVSLLAARGPLGQMALAQELGLGSSAAVALVDRLERQGVVERAPHPSDRRRNVVHLTRGGETLAADELRVLARQILEDEHRA